MSTPSKGFLSKKIRRLEREIAQIEDIFYLPEKRGDATLHAGMLERKRDDVIRGAVLQLHTAIEDILDSQIMCHVLEVPAHQRMRLMRTHKGRALRRLLMTAEGVGFDNKLDLAVALKIISNSRRKRLAVLNTLRNKCSHNWLLKVPVRKGRRPRQMKPPLLLYEGRDVHAIPTFREFIGEYGAIYARMFVEYLDYRDS